MLFNKDTTIPYPSVVLLPRLVICWKCVPLNIINHAPGISSC